MPFVTVKMLEGRTEEQKKALCEKVTEAVSETTGAPPFFLIYECIDKGCLLLSISSST